ncbi:MAG: glycosyltransferase family 39 protein [Ginsengibacter sp.]
MKINTKSNYFIWLALLPFLLLYTIISVIYSHNTFVSDESRYFMFANNILNGYYSPDAPNINLWNGPGYPLLMAFFLFVKLPILSIKIFNAVLLYLSLVISYKTLRFYLSEKKSLVMSLILGLYFPIYESLPFLMTEIPTWFLVALVSYLFIKNFQRNEISWKYIILAALAFAFIALTKIMFGMVLIVSLIVSFLFFLVPGYRQKTKKALIIFFISFIFCTPWLGYTYKLTNNVFYWGDSGGMSLYTMSSPYENELGDWSNERELYSNPNHKEFIDSILILNPVQKDQAYRAMAIKNIVKHPKKYFLNWMANCGRLLFSFPFSNSTQSIKTYFTLIPNMLIMIPLFFAFILCILFWKKLPPELVFLLLFFLIYFFGSSLVSGYRRMFYISMPFWIILISFVFSQIVTIRLKTGDACSPHTENKKN